MTDLLSKLKNVRPSGQGWTALCPGHEDHENSLSVRHEGGRWLIYCHAGCDWRAIVKGLRIRPADLFDSANRRGK